MQNKIYISDLDGTLLDENAQLSDFARKNIINMLDKGINFTVASARNRASLQKILGNIPFRLPVIEINGAYITDYQTGNHLVINQIPNSIITNLCEIITKYNCTPFMSAFDGQKDHLYYEKTLNDGMHWFLNDKTEGHSEHARTDLSNDEVARLTVACLTVIGSYEEIHEIYKEITNSYDDMLDNYFFANPYSPEWQWLTIHSKKANKEIAIKELINLKGFDKKDLTVFGDNINDAGMMKLNSLGSTSIAVGNAIEEIKKLATKTIGPNSEDGVIRYILNDVGIPSIM